MNNLAYIHARPNTQDASGIFYVGKGNERRSKNMDSRNSYYGAIVNKHGKENILIGKMECSDSETAFALEVGLIKCLKASGVKLSNMTDGGEGNRGGLRSESTKEKFRGDNHWSHRNPEKVKSGAEHHNYGRIASEETRAKIGDAQRGEKHWLYGNGHLIAGEKHHNFGKPIPENIKEAMRQANLGRAPWNKGISTSGTPHTDEAKDKIRQSKLGKRYVTNGSITKVVTHDEAIQLLANGWRYGVTKVTK